MAGTQKLKLRGQEPQELVVYAPRGQKAIICGAKNPENRQSVPRTIKTATKAATKESQKQPQK